LEDLLGGDFTPISSPPVGTFGQGSQMVFGQSSLLVDLPRFTLLKPHMGGGLSIDYVYS